MTIRVPGHSPNQATKISTRAKESRLSLFHDLMVVCIPAFNEEKHILEALQSVQSQTHEDFICVIRDNASTDATQSICAQVVAQDKRFFYTRSNVNQGAAVNWQILREITNSPYIMWLGAHDRLAPDYLSKTLRRLNDNHTLSLCYSNVVWIDEAGTTLRQTNGGNFVLDEPDALQRYINVASSIRGECTAINGVIRRSALAKIKKIPVFDGVDHFLLSHLQFQGQFARIDQSLYARRHLVKRTESYSERITGRKTKTTEGLNMWPLVIAHLCNYCRLDYRASTRLRSLPQFLSWLLHRYHEEMPGVRLLTTVALKVRSVTPFNKLN